MLPLALALRHDRPKGSFLYWGKIIGALAGAVTLKPWFVLLGLGLVFEMPMLIFFLARMGIVSAGQLLRWFRWAVLLIFVVAAIITPTPDVATQTVFAVPMILLYLLGVMVAAIFGKKRDADD